MRGACLSWPSLATKMTPWSDRGLLVPEQMAECLPCPGHTRVRQMVRLRSPKDVGRGWGRERKKERGGGDGKRQRQRQRNGERTEHTHQGGAEWAKENRNRK